MKPCAHCCLEKAPKPQISNVLSITVHLLHRTHFSGGKPIFCFVCHNTRCICWPICSLFFVSIKRNSNNCMLKLWIHAVCLRRSVCMCVRMLCISKNESISSRTQIFFWQILILVILFISELFETMTVLIVHSLLLMSKTEVHVSKNVAHWNNIFVTRNESQMFLDLKRKQTNQIVCAHFKFRCRIVFHHVSLGKRIRFCSNFLGRITSAFPFYGHFYICLCLKMFLCTKYFPRHCASVILLYSFIYKSFVLLLLKIPST